MVAFVFIFGGERAGAAGPNPTGLLPMPSSTLVPTFCRGDYFFSFPDKKIRLRSEITCVNLQPGCSIWKTKEECKEMERETKQDHKEIGTSLMSQWLKLQASNAGGVGSVPGRGTKILHTMQCGKQANKKDNK